MSYEKTIWQNGDTITAEKLNKIENGIAESGVTGYAVERSTQLWLNETSISHGSEILVEASAIIEDPNDIANFVVDITFDGTVYRFDSASYDSGSQNGRGYHWAIFDDENEVADIGYYWSEANPSAPFWYLMYPDDETAHTVKIERITINATVTDDFRDAVMYVLNNQY